MSLRVAVAEDSLVREGIVGVLSRQDDLEMVAVTQGKSNAAIAAALYLSERAVEKHINALFTKLDLG